VRRDEERERDLISDDGEDNNTTKKRDTFFFLRCAYARGLHATDGTRSTSLFLSFSLSLYINMLYGLLCVFG